MGIGFESLHHLRILNCHNQIITQSLRLSEQFYMTYVKHVVHTHCKHFLHINSIVIIWGILYKRVNTLILSAKNILQWPSPLFGFPAFEMFVKLMPFLILFNGSMNVSHAFILLPAPQFGVARHHISA